MFKVIPVIDEMISIYERPRDMDRFAAYLRLLEAGTNHDLAIPAQGYNPMAGEAVLSQLRRLKAAGAEDWMRQATAEVNALAQHSGSFSIAFTLADDLKGGWTNRWFTDYDYRFKLGGLVSRGLAVALCFASEDIDNALVTRRTKAACFRSNYFKEHGKPVTLEDHFRQELHSASGSGMLAGHTDPFKESRLEQYRLSTRQDIIMNCLYGDEAVRGLGFTSIGIDAPIMELP